MAELTGSEILARSLKNEGTDILFFLMGGPMLLAESSCIKEGIRPLDVRHEQSAALMGQAYSRLLQKPAVCMAASGPGVINLTTGIANALIDCAPVVAIGGSSPIGQFGRQVFQEIDQLAIMKPCTKWADRVYNLKRIPEQVNNAFQRAMLGKPGPVYLDFPGDILYAKIPEEQVDWSLSGRPLLDARPLGDERQVAALVDAIRKAKQPIILSGSGVIWSQAWAELTELVEASGIPFYTTPQGRGVLPDDHPYSYLSMRSTAFREADLIIVVGTRMNYIISHAAPPRFNAAAKVGRIDIDADEIANARHRHRRRLQDGAPPGSVRGQRPFRQGSLRPVAQEARGRRGGKAHGARRQSAAGRCSDPPAAALRRDQELHETRRHPGRGRPGDPQLRPPVDAHLCARSSPEFRSVRHDGRWPAVRARRQARQARQAGHRPPRRRLVRAQCARARHRGAPQHPGAGRDQPQRRLDRRSRRQQAGPQPRLYAVRQDGGDAGLPWRQ